MSFESQLQLSISNLGPISHRSASIALNGLQGHPRSLISI